MSDIECVVSEGQGGEEYFWEQINHNDDGAAQLIESGHYQVEVDGNFTGSAQIDIQHSTMSESQVKDIDTTNLRFTENGTYGVNLARGYVKPTRTSGSAGADIDVKISRIII